MAAETLEVAAFRSGAVLAHRADVASDPDLPQALWRDRLALAAVEVCVIHSGRSEGAVSLMPPERAKKLTRGDLLQPLLTGDTTKRCAHLRMHMVLHSSFNGNYFLAHAPVTFPTLRINWVQPAAPVNRKGIICSFR